MKLKPEYAQIIIVMIKYQNEWSWYITERDWWYLDYTKWTNAFEKKGINVISSQDYSDRFGIAIVNRDTVNEFLLNIAAFKASTEELRNIMEKNVNDDICAFAPVLYIDFDSQLLISYYPESASYEDFVPEGWVGSYEDFLCLIPDHYKYWIVKGVNYFEE